VLLNRPYLPQNIMETVNDKDSMLANVWRSLQLSPDETARWADWPVNHCDLQARKIAIINNETRLIEGLAADPEWHDSKLAGYWIWAASCWIGSGLTRLGQISHVGDAGMGVHALGPRPHLSDAGMGVHALGPRPHLSDAGMGVTDPYNTHTYSWFRQLSERLRYVRVVCGNWTQVCGGNWQDKCGDVGIFFDPPYGVLDRDTAIYHHDSTSIAAEVEDWSLKRGNKRSYRIVIAGYLEEYQRLQDAGWRIRQWKANGGYANTNGANDTRGRRNRFRECLFFSPHCRNDKLF
jgi:DNA adenine methylase